MYANERWCYWSQRILIPLGAGVTSRSELQDMGARKRTRVPWVSSTLSCWTVSSAPPLISGVLFSFLPFPIFLLSFLLPFIEYQLGCPKQDGVTRGIRTKAFPPGPASLIRQRAMREEGLGGWGGYHYWMPLPQSQARADQNLSGSIHTPLQLRFRHTEKSTLTWNTRLDSPKPFHSRECNRIQAETGF